METGSHAIANPTMWKAVEIILGIALVTPENITDQFAEAVLTWIPGSKYNACCIKVMYAAHKKSWWVQVSGWSRRKLEETKGIKRIQKVLLSPFISEYLEDPFHETSLFQSMRPRRRPPAVASLFRHRFPYLAVLLQKHHLRKLKGLNIDWRVDLNLWDRAPK